jgi:poly-gamma-glutamate synthesis protein (capsule biosynthesis protein)
VTSPSPSAAVSPDVFETATAEPSPEQTPDIVHNEEDVIRIKLTAIGDIMSHYTQILDAYDSTTDTYDYSNSLQYVKYYTKAADITIGNLETSMAEGAYTGYPTFNTPAALAKNLKDIGIDMVSLANNHCMDKGFDGLVSTIENVEAAGLDHIGTYGTQDERDETHGVLIKNVNGINIAFLCYTYGTNYIWLPEGKEFSVSLLFSDYMGAAAQINTELILDDLAYAKTQDVDLIVSLIHCGTEYQNIPNEKQEEVADFLFKNGVDVIIGNHVHVIQPMEIRTITTNEGQEKDVFICYALGNFMSNITRKVNTLTGLILNLNIEKDLVSGKTSVVDYDYVPLYMLTPEWGGSRFYVLPTHAFVNEYQSGTSTLINEKIYTDMCESLDICESVLGREHDYYYIERK